MASAASPTNANSRAGCGAHLVRHLELADQLRRPLGAGELGAVGKLADHPAVGGLGIGTELGQPRLVGNNRDYGEAVLVGKDGRRVRIEHPYSGLAPRRAHFAPVGEVGETVVWAYPGGNPGQSSDRRIASVGGHGELRAERALLLVRALDLDALGPAPIAEQADHRLAGEVLDARPFGPRAPARSDRGFGERFRSRAARRPETAASPRTASRRPPCSAPRPLARVTAPVPAARSWARRWTGSGACR